MRAFRFVFSWLLVPRSLLILAGLCAAAGVVLAYVAIHDAADRKLALRQGPPPAVALEDYRPLAHRGPAGEVVLRARADLGSAFVFELPGSDERALLVPLFPLGDGQAREAHGAIFVPLEDEAVPAADGLALQDPAGWVEVNGIEADAGDFRLMLAGALAAEGRTLGARATVVRPFVGGREAAFQPPVPPSRPWAWFLTLALGLVLAAIFADARGVPTEARARTHGPRSPVVSTRFAPLQHLEDDEPVRRPAAWHALRMAAGTARSALAGLARLSVAAVRTVWQGIEGLRSPR